MRELFHVRPKGGAAYPVLAGCDARRGLERVWEPAWRSCAVIGDENTLGRFGARLVEALAARGVRFVALSFPPGEVHKTRATKERLEDAMLEAGIERTGCVVGVGGGIALDVAGFVAATYLRGVAHVNVATTLLAQVDAAIGGKTGVNTVSGKNLVGAFHHPRAVLLDTGALATLPKVELECGLAEAMKHAVLRDAALFDELDAWAAGRDAAGRDAAALDAATHGGAVSGAMSLVPPDAIIARCAAIKAEVIAEDDRDLGVRNILNFGHTVAHALEAATKHATSHGHAVGIGMVIEARLAAIEGWLDVGEASRIEALAARLGLPTKAPCPFSLAAPYLASDKKNQRGEVHCALPTAIGRTEAPGGAYTRSVSLDALERAWK